MSNQGSIGGDLLQVVIDLGAIKAGGNLQFTFYNFPQGHEFQDIKMRIVLDGYIFELGALSQGRVHNTYAPNSKQELSDMMYTLKVMGT